MLKKAKILKWIFVAVLGISVVFFFLPYVFVNGEYYNPMKMIWFINKYKSEIRSDAMFEVTFSFVVPVILTALSALIMAFRTSIPKCVICVILNLLAVGIYYLVFKVSFLDVNFQNIRIGFIGNIVIACVGVILPIVNVVFYKIAAKKSISEA